MKVHHLEIVCRDLSRLSERFISSFGFSLCHPLTSYHPTILLKQGSVYVLLRQDVKVQRDSVDNVALEVGDVDHVCEQVRRFGVGSVLVSPRSITENGVLPGEVRLAVVKSPVGNVKHTLLDKRSYQGMFLPGDVLDYGVKNDCRITNLSRLNVKPLEMEQNYSSHIRALDHITFAVNQQMSFACMDWYEKCLGFSRFLVNNEEKTKGFIVKTKNNAGNTLTMRLTAMQEHLCNEVALRSSQNETNSVKFVFAESLDGQGPNQIDNFLTEHGGPGIQHVGLLTSDICHSAKQWKKNDIAFLTPPIHYYNEIKDILAALPSSLKSVDIQKHGILVDTEECVGQMEPRFLLQMFTKPIFNEDTFFFELIQRHGAVGFGAGNIGALWRAVDAYLREIRQKSESLVSS